MIDICIGIAGPLVVFAFILSSLCNATRSGVLVGRGTRTLAKRIVISGRLYQLMLLLILPFYRTHCFYNPHSVQHPIDLFSNQLFLLHVAFNQSDS